MNEELNFLLQRASCARLAEPAPSAEELEPMFAAAMRAPDHARLRPWRFLCVRGERRVELGQRFREALLVRDPAADSAAQDKAANAPLRAPLLVVAIASISEHPKVPPIEQRLAAGCATYGLLLAAEASGYAGIWRTGEVAFDRTVMNALGLAANEEIIGFLYLGTREGDCRALPRLAVDQYVAEW
ncbi:nitroreductase [Mangrovimicrobium sediminis]|uniref:Putative NAD(P)H nitroreductase n=1 Tax=Mangrovimicrobium sediminis TaxID=2562682 RepID=A0A4Z0M5L0_9GAMM|nr:nitroreductase [Haliea sp. SAOS-164]TGD74726.1 nitroreductase [Haliea sp. SAOS-164]